MARTSTIGGSGGLTPTELALVQSLGALPDTAPNEALKKSGSSIINDDITGSLVYKGVWNANTNSPTVTTGVGELGWYYYVGTGGTTTVDGISTWGVGDMLLFNGTAWQKIDNQGGAGSGVSSWNGATGVVTAGIDDLTDVAITSAGSGDYLRFNGTNWVDSTIQATDIPSGVDALKIGAGNVSNTEYNYLDGVNNPIQTQLDGKLSTSATTSDVPEGSRLYFTDERAQDAVAAALSNSGDITFTYNDTLNTIIGDVANDKITNAKLANMANSTIKARKTSGTGDPEDCTLSEVLDFIGSAAQGDILYRDASAWSRLPAGTSGYFLRTSGAAANPAWAAPAVESVQFTVSLTAHGFSQYDVVRPTTGGSYTKAQSDTSSNAELVGLVVTVINANSFVLLTHGKFSFTGTPKDVYFLSASVAGALTTTAPTGVGQVSKPLVTVLASGTEAMFNNQRGIVITATVADLPWYIPYSANSVVSCFTDGMRAIPSQPSNTSVTLYGTGVNQACERYIGTTSQSVANITTIWASATVARGAAVVGGFLYLLLFNGTTEVRMYRCDITLDISTGGNWGQVTLSGANFLATSTFYLSGYGNSVFWFTDTTGAAYVYGTLASTTITQGGTVTVTSADYGTESTINAQGIFATFAAAPFLRLANFAGTLQTSKNIRTADNQRPLSIQDKIYIRDNGLTAGIRIDL